MMPKYIDTDNILQGRFTFPQESEYARGWNDGLEAVAENAPSADVVPVVRGEWKWQEVELKKLKLGNIPPKQGECWCNWWDSAVNLSGFCSCGERITE